MSWFTFASHGVSAAELSLHALFSDHAVFQRDQPVPVWGRGAPGQTVTVEFGGGRWKTEVGQDGRWSVELDPLPTSSTPDNLIVQMNGQTVERENILVGEVWLASGQSNMNWRLRNINDGEREVADANHPNLRFFQVPVKASADPLDTVDARWEVCTPQRAARGLAAVPYFFGRDLMKSLEVPVGIVIAACGSTEVESWMSFAALQSDPAFPEIMERHREWTEGFPALMERYQERLAAYEAEVAAAETENREMNLRRPRDPSGANARKLPAGLFNGMIHPLEGWMPRGVIWYQGESNSQRPEEYTSLFRGLILDWRDLFAQPGLPFYFVQLANLDTPRPWALFREAQAQVLDLPQTGMAVAVDIGDSKDIHPGNKQDVGRRLVLLALARTYGWDVVDSGPVLQRVNPSENGLLLEFGQVETLTLREIQPNGFEVAGENRVFHPAEARLTGPGSVWIGSEFVPAPVAVRYAWESDPPVSLYNEAGLPAAPFRSDDWED